MAKAITTTIRTVSGNTVKVDKLTDRTFRTLKTGDYIVHTMAVRGTQVTFYGQVDMHSGNGSFTLSFGSHGKTVDVSIPKGVKFPVFRPTSA